MQKNLTVVDLAPGDSADIRVQFGSLAATTERRQQIEVILPKGAAEAAGTGLLGHA